MIGSLTRLDLRRISLLHEQGFSSRWIANRLQISRETVREYLQKLAAVDPGLETRRTSDNRPPGFDAVNLRRCRGCGGLVYLWPCLACGLSEGATETLA